MMSLKNAYLFSLISITSLNLKGQDYREVFSFPHSALSNRVYQIDTFYTDVYLGLTYYDSIGHFLFSEIYYPNGELKSYQVLMDVRFFGKYALSNISWNVNGSIQTYTILGPLFYESYYSRDSSNNTTIYNIDSIGNGFGIKYDALGNILIKIKFTPLEDSVVEYNSNGQIVKKYQKIFGTKIFTGEYVSYDDRGQLDTLGNYMSYVEMESLNLFATHDPIGVKNGLWHYYENGKLFKTEVWKMDSLITVSEEKKKRKK